MYRVNGGNNALYGLCSMARNNRWRKIDPLERFGLSGWRAPWMVAVVLLSALITSGCMSTRQIETSTPRVFNTPEAEDANAAGMSLLSVTFRTGETDVPEDVQALRFRIDEVRLRTETGEWLSFPSELNNFEILAGRRQSKTILATRVIPQAYDSLAIQLSDIFVLFDENAGSALTMARDGVSRQRLQIEVETGSAKRLEVVFEPQASLAKTPDCRWQFVPFWTVLSD